MLMGLGILGVLLVVLLGYSFVPRASFVITFTILIHKLNIINLHYDDGKTPSEVITIIFILVSILVTVGVFLDLWMLLKNTEVAK